MGGTTLFLCGDVMTGRGVDQILPHPNKPRIYESYLRSALDYVRIAERVNGPIKKAVDFAYIWGDALAELERMRPVARIINLETAVTAAEDAWPDKGIHYRMHPANLPCLAAAAIDCCVLANNHVLDWGYAGLSETLDTLHATGIHTAGAGRSWDEAAAPGRIELAGGGRLLVFAFGHESAGIPPEWAAQTTRAGVNFLDNLSPDTAEALAGQICAARRPGDIVVASLHWGGNWDYAIPAAQRNFAHRLVDLGAVDVVHGHSSHHPKAIEVYRGKLILYGCGDFLNDYEGIGGHVSFRSDLALMYFATLDAAHGALVRLTMSPMRIRKFRLTHAPDDDVQWLEELLNRDGQHVGTRVERQSDGTLQLHWG